MSIESDHDQRTITVHVPLTIRRRGHRKRVIAPDGSIVPQPTPARVDGALVKAIARAYRWQRMLESGEYASIADLAAAERINRSYVSRVLRLTMLAPEIVERIMAGNQGEGITLEHAMGAFPSEWENQDYSAVRLSKTARNQKSANDKPWVRTVAR
jgi:hypothetical protein